MWLRVNVGNVCGCETGLRFRAAGRRLPLSPFLINEATRSSAPGEDHLGRVRIASTLGVPAPAADPVGELAQAVGVVRAGHLTAARATARMLAATGPLDLPALAGAVAPTRRFRSRKPLFQKDLAAADHGRVHPGPERFVASTGRGRCPGSAPGDRQARRRARPDPRT
jgi:hypothetical protein